MIRPSVLVARLALAPLALVLAIPPAHGEPSGPPGAGSARPPVIAPPPPAIPLMGQGTPPLLPGQRPPVLPGPEPQITSPFSRMSPSSRMSPADQSLQRMEVQNQAGELMLQQQRRDALEQRLRPGPSLAPLNDSLRDARRDLDLYQQAQTPMEAEIRRQQLEDSMRQVELRRQEAESRALRER